MLLGDLDVATAPELDQCLSDVLSEDHVRVLVDLNGLSFVDSAGVTVLLRAKKAAQAMGCQLFLRRPTAQLQSVFAVIGLADWLDFED